MTFRTSIEPVTVRGKIGVVALSAAEDALLPLRLKRISAMDDGARFAKVRDGLGVLSQERAIARSWLEAMRERSKAHASTANAADE